MPPDIFPPNRRILVVDDNASIHDDFRKTFRRFANRGMELSAVEAALFCSPEAASPIPVFEVDFAHQGGEALGKVREAIDCGIPYAMAFIDMRMPPGWDGLETTARLWELSPDLQVVICTAYSDYTWEAMTARFGPTDRLVLLMKPFDPVEVLQLAQALTEKWRLRQETRAHTVALEHRVAERTQDLQIANELLRSEMAERALAEAALRQAQKMEAVGQLAAGVAHDYNNILSIILGYTGILLGQSLDGGMQEALQEIERAAQRAAGLTRQLLTFSDRQVRQPETLNPADVVAQVGKLLRCMLGGRVTLVIESRGTPPLIFADRSMMEQVLLNLAVNARDAMPEGGHFTVGISTVELSVAESRGRSGSRPGRYACLTVADTGAGIPRELQPRLFEPFFTTKEVGRGTGLGLATVYGIVRQHEGWIEVESETGRGTTFRIYLPESTPAMESAPASAAIPESRDKATILVVEDEDALRNAARIVLEHYGYRVVTARSGAEALSIWPEHAQEVDLVFTDMVMPEGVSGRELGKRLQAGKPGLKVIYSSGYSRELADEKGVLQEGLDFLPKPYSPAQLARIVHVCMERGIRPAEVAA